MRIVALSDTHGEHWRLSVPDGDVLVFAGDCSMTHHDGLCEEFITWYASQPHKHKLFVAGNHDWDIYHGRAVPRPSRGSDGTGGGFARNGILYLEDWRTVIDGVNFYGTPWQPNYYSWAYNENDTNLAERYALIPDDTHVLITHCPPLGVLDRVEGNACGCPVLANSLKRLPALKYHIFGHIHEGYGVHSPPDSDCRSFNVAICNENYDAVRPPTIIDL